MTERIHLVVERADKEHFRRAAARGGRSLSEWLREAAHEKLARSEAKAALDSAERLRDFFAECTARESGREPDWDAHREVIERSVRSGATST
jgi:hypothetical protein